MRAELFQYIHEGHQGKERCLLHARNTVFWPKITFDVQELIERCIIYQEHGKSQSIIGTTEGTSSISMAHTGNRYFLLEENGLSHNH